MYSMKKGLSTLVVFFIFLMLCSCGVSEEKKIETVEEQQTEVAQQQTDVEKQEEIKEDKKEDLTKISIEEQVLLEYEGIKITAKGLEESYLGPEMKVLIENDSANDITVSLTDVVVNDYMMDSFLYETVAAGKKSNAKFNIFNSNLKNAGITNIGKIELYFNIIDSSYNTIYDSDAIEVHTSIFDKMDSTINDFGKELVNESGIRIVGNYYKKNSVWGSSIVLYIENNTDRNLTISAEDLSVNGFMINEFFYQRIRPHKMAISTIYLSQSDLEENDIEEVEEISTKFLIYDTDSYRDILKTNEISFNVEQ